MAAHAGEIVLPAAVERDAPVSVSYRTNGLATGQGSLLLRWTDSYGRVIEDRSIAVELNDESEIGFKLDLRRAIAMKNELRVHFSFTGVNKRGQPDKREEDARITFIARPPHRAWRDYAIMMWQSHSSAGAASLKSVGINGGEFSGKAKNPPAFLLDNDLRWYAENIATDFYSEYHRWHPDRVNHWKYLFAKELYRKNPNSLEPFKRHPSLSDPLWLQVIHDRLVESVHTFSPYRPFFYSLGDETGIADLAAFWDFDFSDDSLQEMRKWLRTRYSTLAELNSQWGTDFVSWDLVVPETTDQAMKRADDNYSSWADFKAWMDVAYARALKMGNDAVRSADPDARAGIGGGQMPGWGGYDYWLISQSLTAIEPYDIGNNIEILRSFNPAMAVMTTSFAAGPWEKHRVWYELLHGNRGLIIWDDKNGFVTKQGELGDRARETAPYYNEIRNGLGALLINSRREGGPVAIHYSQASMRTDWMIRHKPEGSKWVDRNSSTERRDSDFLRLRESWCRLIEDEGLQYDFVSYAQVEQGQLLRGGYRALVLPQSIALSAAETRAIADFARQGGLVLMDGMAGQYDEHSRKLARAALSPSVVRNENLAFIKGDTLNYHQNRLIGKEGAPLKMMEVLFSKYGIRPEFAVTEERGGPAVGVETHVFQNGAVRLIGLLSNPQLRVDELGPPEFKSNDRFAKPRTVRLRLPQEMSVYDVRKAESLGRRQEMEVALDPYEPAIFAVSAVALPKLELHAPGVVKRGETGRIGLAFAGDTPAATHVLRADVMDSAGNEVPYYSANVIAPRGRAALVLPLAQNDRTGTWRVRVRDMLSGQTKTALVDVR